MRRAALATSAILLAGCSAGHAAPADGGPGPVDAHAPDDATTSAESGSGAHPDASTSSSGGDAASSGGGEAGSSSGGDASSSGGGDAGSGADASDASCSTTDGGPSVALTWNEGCSSTVTGFVIEWGDVDGGPYPYSADAGDSCDATACDDDAAGAQAFCQYDLRGLEAGTWCIAAEACDDGSCSVPSMATCVDVPPACL
ncbi:MAG TPA: hypothetical protein VGG39_03500 [Polyangiaceae bacterium]